MVGLFWCSHSLLNVSPLLLFRSQSLTRMYITLWFKETYCIKETCKSQSKSKRPPVYKRTVQETLTAACTVSNCYLECPKSGYEQFPSFTPGKEQFRLVISNWHLAWVLHASLLQQQPMIRGGVLPSKFETRVETLPYPMTPSEFRTTQQTQKTCRNDLTIERSDLTLCSRVSCMPTHPLSFSQCSFYCISCK
jgi:hypothetical protein